MNVIFVVGPTASGKSSLALKLAHQSQGVIINCDSVQVYAHVQIGAAKPTVSDMALVPHYLYGHVAPPMEYTAGMYHRDFFQQLKLLERKGVDQVFVVGGTGFYFQAIEKGMFDVQESLSGRTDELVKEASTPEGYEQLLEELRKGDPDSALRFHPNDRYRILRAIEILRFSGKKPSELRLEKLQEASEFPYPLRKIGIDIDRAELHQRIHKRVKAMLQEGLIDEVRELNNKKLFDWPPLKSVGYREVQEYLNGGIKTLQELETQILISTRQLAKRQITWFKRDKEIQWQTLT